MSEAKSIQKDCELPVLHQISLLGDIAGLQRLIREDGLVLDRVSGATLYGETPLHIAAMRGYFHFARVLLTHKPQLALELDSLGRVPLHWASEKGYTDIVKELLLISPDACFWRDQDGKIPLHLAAINGRMDVILQLVRTQPETLREKVENGGTILHLCVKYNSFDALKLLLNTAQGHELLNASDDYGNTILDVAVIFKQVGIMKYLLLERNDINMNGFTSLEAAGYPLMDPRALEMKLLLLEEGINKLKNNTYNLNARAPTTSVTQKCKSWWNKCMKNVEFGLQQARGSILIAATVTASMAFQAGINPPRFGNQAVIQLKAKEIFENPLFTNILRPDRFDPSHGFWLYNSKSLIYSLAIIMLMQSGIPIRNKLSNVTLVIGMCSVVMSTLLAYYYAAKEANLVEEDIQLYIKVFGFMFNLVIVVHVCTFLMSLASKVFNVSKC